MSKTLPKKFIFLVLLVMSLDCLFTFLGQSQMYWTSFKSVNESSPMGYSLLASNPLLFLAFFIVYLILAFFLMKKLPIFWGTILGMSLFLGHAWGSSSWLYTLYLKMGLPQTESLRWYLPIAYFIFLSIISSLSIFYGKKK